MVDKWQRRRYAVLYSCVLGKAVIVDTFFSRHMRMRSRLAVWAMVALEYRESHPSRMVMITLTYKRIRDWKANHIREYMKNLKQRLGDKLKMFAWVAEVQTRGAVHYHILLIVDKGSRIPMPDKSRMWSHGSSRIETARTPYYIMTYTGKEHQKDLARFPKGARTFAVSYRFEGWKEKVIVAEGSVFCSVGADNLSATDDPDVVDDWEFRGASVTGDYAKDCLVPLDAVSIVGRIEGEIIK